MQTPGRYEGVENPKSAGNLQSGRGQSGARPRSSRIVTQLCRRQQVPSLYRACMLQGFSRRAQDTQLRLLLVELSARFICKGMRRWQWIMIGGGEMIQRSCRKAMKELGWYSYCEEKSRDLSCYSVVDIRVEWLCSLSGGALRFAPFLTCKLAGLELPPWYGSAYFQSNRLGALVLSSGL